MPLQNLPLRVQQELQAAEALETADQAARAQAQAPAARVADLVAPAAPVAAAPAPVAAPPAAPAAPSEDFAQKYRTLQGMYREDVTQLKAQLKTLTEAMQSLKAERPAPAQESKPAVDPGDIAKFGEEMMDMVQRYVTGAVKALEARIAGLEATVTGVTQETAVTKEQQFYQLLTSLAPDWREVNADARWLAWLGERDEVYGVPRQAALDNAFNSGNAEQVAKVFAAFKRSLPAVPAAPSLDTQLSPGSAASAAPEPQSAKPILSSAAITAHYNDVSRGKFVGREAEAEALEAQINLAVAEGRVR